MNYQAFVPFYLPNGKEIFRFVEFDIYSEPAEPSTGWSGGMNINSVTVNITGRNASVIREFKATGKLAEYIEAYFWNTLANQDQRA